MSDLWQVEQADAIEWLDRQPDDSIDLLVTSPPYERARTYGISKALPAGQDWVDWMVEVVTAAAPKVKGLIAINCEGQTRQYRYSTVPFLLMADLHRAGFNLRKPLVFHRVGIPGSGGPDWFRNDWEPIICVTREGKLPWSDNTACGHPPKWAPGGAMSNRTEDGKRKNARGYSGKINDPWGYAAGKGGGRRDRNGKREPHPKSNGKLGTVDSVHTKRDPDGTMREQGYNVPVLANPGNILSLNVGGGTMGHASAHDNEAPFPVELPAFLVKSCCPPDGIVADCFVGSGTTIQAAVENGRRFRGCDIRVSQVELCKRRMATITRPLFAS